MTLQMSLGMTKPTKWCARSEDSDQSSHPPNQISLRCPHEEALGPWLPFERTARTDQTRRMSRLIAGRTTFCWFYRAATQISSGTAKPTKLYANSRHRPTCTSVRHRPAWTSVQVWLEALLSAWLGLWLTIQCQSKTDKTALMRRLIWVFAAF